MSPPPPATTPPPHPARRRPRRPPPSLPFPPSLPSLSSLASPRSLALTTLTLTLLLRAPPASSASVQCSPVDLESKDGRVDLGKGDCNREKVGIGAAPWHQYDAEARP